MQNYHRRGWSINHSLSPQTEEFLSPRIQEYDIPILNKKTQNYHQNINLNQAAYKLPKSSSILKQRSRKHRLIQQRNTEIQKTNQRLFQKIRKIKMKNMYHSERKIQSLTQQQLPIESLLNNGLLLPKINDLKNSVKTSTTISNRMNSTKSQLNNILEDRVTFVQQYFTDLKQKRNRKVPDEELGNFVSENGWKIKVLLVDGDNLVLVGKKGREQLTKKYIYSKVKNKMTEGLQPWVKYKYSFQK